MKAYDPNEFGVAVLKILNQYSKLIYLSEGVRCTDHLMQTKLINNMLPL